MTPEKVYRARGLSAALFDDAMADTTPLAEIIAQLRRPEDVRRDRARVPEGPPADDRHDRSRRPAAGDLEHRRDRGQRPSRRAGAVPQDPARLGGDPRRLPAGDDRRRDRRQASIRRCMSTAAPSPSSSSIRRRSISPRAAFAGVRHAYIIRNARLDPDYAASERRTISIAGRAISTMLARAGTTTCCALTSSASATASTTTSPTSARISRSEDRRVRPGLHAGALPVWLSSRPRAAATGTSRRLSSPGNPPRP